MQDQGYVLSGSIGTYIALSVWIFKVVAERDGINYKL